MALRRPPVAVLLLLPVGVLAGHAVGYAGAGHVHGEGVTAAHSHGYLGLVAPVAACLALLGALASLLRLGTATVSFRLVLILQWTALLLQEGVEHLLAGEPAVTLLLFPPLWLGVIAQVAVAAGATLLLRSARAVGLRLASLPARLRLAVAATGSIGPEPVLGVSLLGSPLSFPARAPPLGVR